MDKTSACIWLNCAGYCFLTQVLFPFFGGFLRLYRYYQLSNCKKYNIFLLIAQRISVAMVLTDFDNHQINASYVGRKKRYPELLLLSPHSRHSFKVSSKGTKLLIPHVSSCHVFDFGLGFRNSYACLCVDVPPVMVTQNLMTEISNILCCLWWHNEEKIPADGSNF